MDVHAVDLGRELRQGFELCLRPAPVVIILPVVRELPQGRELHALRAIWRELLTRPARRGDAAVQLGEILFGDIDLEGADLDGGLDGATHEDIPLPAKKSISSSLTRSASS